MKTFSIRQVLNECKPTEELVRVQGWIKTRRDSKAGLSFIHLNDGSCFSNLQIIAAETLYNYHTEILHLTAGCSVQIEGQLVASPAAGQNLEMQASRVVVLGWIEDPETYPISPKHHTLEYCREVAHLRPRTNTFGAMTRIRHAISQAIHRYFDSQEFYWVHTPVITASDCEGAGEMFRVSTLDLLQPPKTSDGKIDFTQDFFGKETFLTVSGQLNVECFCCALSKVYTFGPTFRAENSNTSRHLAEFWMIEPEIAFADLSEDATLAENLLRYVCKTLLDHHQEDMQFFNKQIDKSALSRLEMLANTNFERLNYTTAIGLLEQSKQTFEFPIRWGLDLQAEHERYLTEKIFQKPLILMNYPKDIKAFYMRLNDDGKTVAAMDVLVPGIGEIIGGSQREERLTVLDQRLDEMKLPKEHYQWYRDLRRYGTVPHAGFGLGLERLVSYLTGLGNVRDVIPFPRTPGSVAY